MKSCLIIVDMQNGFITKDTEHIVDNLEELIAEGLFDIVIASKFVNTKTSPCVTITDWNEMFESKDTDLLSCIESASNLIIEKDIYTALNNDVLDLIRLNKITEVYVVGVNTDCCVLKTALDLFENNIRPILLTDYCASTMGDNIHTSAVTVLSGLIGENNVISGRINKKRIEELKNIG